MSDRIPLGRIGSDEDVARTVAFLASPGASYITGMNVVVDGGMAAGVWAAELACTLRTATAAPACARHAWWSLGARARVPW